MSVVFGQCCQIDRDEDSLLYIYIYITHFNHVRKLHLVRTYTRYGCGTNAVKGYIYTTKREQVEINRTANRTYVQVFRRDGVTKPYRIFGEKRFKRIINDNGQRSRVDGGELINTWSVHVGRCGRNARGKVTTD